MPTPLVLATIAGAAIAFIFFLLGIEEHQARRKQFLMPTPADDPFTGTWREKGGFAKTVAEYERIK